MAYWRMRLRNGFANQGGDDMWPACKKELVSAITYNGISEVDLRPYSRGNPPPGWNQVAGGKGSLSHFAWDIRGGDAIYVADSVSHQIVGMGYVRAAIGELAYRFDANSPIAPPNGPAWCHLIDVDWDEAFVPFSYEHPRAPLSTVLELNTLEIGEFERASQEQGHRDRGLPEDEVQGTLLLQDAYTRYTPAALREIHREHAKLSNDFSVWLQINFGIQVTQEEQQIDAKFVTRDKKYLTEFKIAYQDNTKRAIREALGQILEYNHYPPRASHDFWLLILNICPAREDITFLRSLKELYRLPLILGWRTDSGFDFAERLSLAS